MYSWDSDEVQNIMRKSSIDSEILLNINLNVLMSYYCIQLEQWYEGSQWIEPLNHQCYVSACCVQRFKPCPSRGVFSEA